MNLIIFIVVVIIIAVLSVRIIFRRSKNCPPALIRLHAAGIAPVKLSEYWSAVNTGSVRKRC